MAIATWDDTDKEPGTHSPLEGDAKKRHAAAISAFNVSASFFSEQRTREVRDLSFIDFDEQWDPLVVQQRSGQAGGQGSAANGLPPTPARPAITINRLRGPGQQIASQRRNARLALTFSPKGAGAKQELAEIYEDIVRAIQNESRAAIARNWAADRAEKAGLGWYRINTEFALENPTDEAAWNDQEIIYERILNQASVYPDPFAQEPDFSDGKRWYVTEDIPVEIYKEMYPDSKLATSDSAVLSAIGNEVGTNWVFNTNTTDPEKGQTIRVAECWEVIETRKQRKELSNGASAFEGDELPKGVTFKEGGRSRTIVERKIEWSKINAIEYLEEPREWNGKYAPLIPTVGIESNVNGERRWVGFVGPAKESAVAYNVMRSAQIESIGLAAKAPYIGYYETIEPYIEWWKNSNTRNFPMLPLKAVYDKAGNLLPPPQRNVAEPAIQAITLAASEAKDDIHATTGIPPVALGSLDQHDRSGKAIDSLKAQAETGSSVYLDNLANISLPYEGKVLRDLIPRIFDRPKRIVPAIGVDDKRRVVMLNWPYVSGPDGQPVPLPSPGEEPVMLPGKDGQPQPLPFWSEGDPVPEGVKYYDLKQGEFYIACTLGKDYPTQRKESAAFMTDVLKVVPPEMSAAMVPAMLEEQDSPGSRRLAKIAISVLPPALQHAYQDEDGQSDVPPEVRAQMDQMQAQLQEAAKIIETEQVKQQATLQKAQLDAQTSIQIEVAKQQAETERARENNAAKFKLEQMKVVADLLKTRATLEQTQTLAQLDAATGELDREVAAAGEAEERTLQTQEAEKDRGLQRETQDKELSASAQEAERQRQAQQQEARESRQFEAEMTPKEPRGN